MNISKILPVTTLCLGLFYAPSFANAQGCTLDGVRLNCSANGNNPANIMASFASQETRTTLATPLLQKERFNNNGDLELYRRSMERNWRIITRLARRNERNRAHRRISKSKFQLFLNEFSDAKRTYDVALNFYRQLHWQGFK